MAGLADCDPLSYPYRERNDGTWMTMVSRFKLGGRLCTARLVSTDYGENRPGHPIKADVRSKVHAKSIRHGEMALHGRHDFNPNDVRTLANGSCHDQTQRWLQGMEAGGAEFRAESGAPTLTAGHKFELEDTPVSAGDERRFLLVEVTHQALDGRDQESGYSNTFTCVATSNSTAFTPRIIPEKPRVWGPQTAEVVDINSPQGSQSHASVKVRFPWQEDETSCWARVAQLYAGPEWGSYFVPDIGQEVLVEYVNGDPDRPVIVGAVYNDSNPIPPYTDTQSGIRTRGSNYNELRFDDKRGSEEVYFQAGRDHNFLVNNDEAGEIGHDQKIEIGNDKTTEVGANVKLEAGQNIDVTSKMGSIKVQSKAGKIDIEAATGITLKVGSSSIEMTPAGITIKSTMIDVNGTMVTVKANAMAEVSSSAMLTLRGGLTRIN
jgi:type VI secretion system secreted protein VgrG